MSPFRTPGSRPDLLDLRASFIAFAAMIALLIAAFIGFTQPQVSSPEPTTEEAAMVRE